MLPKPSQGVGDPAIVDIVDIVLGQDVQTWRQGANAQPIAGMQDDGTFRVGTEDVAAGVVIQAQFASRAVGGLGSSRRTKQLTGEQPSTARLMGYMRFGPIRDRHEDTVLIDAKPSPARHRITSGHEATRALEHLGRLTTPGIRFLAIAGRDDRGIFHDTKQ